MNTLSRFVVLLSHSVIVALAQQAPPQGSALHRTTIVEETLTLGPPDEQVEVPVVFEKLTVDVSSEVTQVDFPFRGLLLIHVRAGELEVVIDDETATRRTGDFIVVPPGSGFGVRTRDDQVILASYLIGESYVETSSDKPIASGFVRPQGFYEETAPNLRSREAYRIGDPEHPIAVIRDFNVGPGLRTEPYRFEGAAMMQVSSGRSRMIIGDRERDSTLGDGVGVSDGESFVVDNSQSDRPFKLRAFILQK